MKTIPFQIKVKHKNYLLLFMLGLFLLKCPALKGQEIPDTVKEEISSVIEKKPEFPGGEKALLQFIVENVKYPSIARENGIEGTVVVQFIIDKEGHIIQPTVVKKVGGGCDEAALEVVRKMPNWVPGTQNGKPVYVQYNMPIGFKLQGRTRSKNEKKGKNSSS